MARFSENFRAFILADELLLLKQIFPFSVTINRLIFVTVWLRTVPHDTKDDVVEKFLSKILPGSGTVFRSEHHHVSVDQTTASIPAGSTPPTATRQTAKRTDATTTTRSSFATPLKSAPYKEALTLRKTKRPLRKCKTVPIVSRNGNHVQVTSVCYHVSEETAAP